MVDLSNIHKFIKKWDIGWIEKNQKYFQNYLIKFVILIHSLFYLDNTQEYLNKHFITQN